ncbi:MAG: SIR2 family protein [Lewinellaceae bacterium]|nr:SIR2 family protein [Lewinellaceae bacterium]
METFNWDDILDDIADQRAVLLLGHNFLPGAQEQLHAALLEKLGDKLQHFYSRDGLFLFRDSDAKTTAQQLAARFFRNNAPDDAMLKKIAEMPFRLMISANPDKFLPDAFAKYKLRLQFDYFSSNNKEEEHNVGRPTEENPLLYNLCGSVEDQESLILDYDDLFKMLKTLLADLKIPNEIRLPLMKTTTYIFVGFHFERWYTQLFLRYLNMNDNQFSNNSRNYVLNTTFRDTDMERFFLQQFNILRYIGADWTFFEELHRRFEEKYPVKLRRLIDQLSPTAAAVAQLVAKGEDESAISMLNIFKGQLPADDQEQLVMTEAAYNQYLADKKTVPC